MTIGRPRERGRAKFLVWTVAVASGGCFHHRDPGLAKTASPVFAVRATAIGQSRVAMGCLPRSGDSTRFEVDFIVDSVRESNADALTIVRDQRSPPRAGTVSQVVTVEVRRAGQTRLVGTSCWQDAGIVIRGSATVLAGAEVHVVVPGAVVVRAFDARGTVLVESVRLDGLSGAKQITWRPGDG